MSTKKDKDFGKTKVLDINAHKKFLEDKLRQYKKKQDVEAKAETVNTVKSASEANTARLLGKSSGGKSSVSNLFNNDGSFLDQFRKMTGQNNAAVSKKEASSGSKALLQSKVKEDSKQIVKVDSLKYKQPSRSIMLPSFKGVGGSNQATKKEVQEIKEEVKEDKHDSIFSSHSGFGSFDKNQMERKEKKPEKAPPTESLPVPSASSHDLPTAHDIQSSLETSHHSLYTTEAANLFSALPKSQPEQRTASETLPIPTSSQNYSYLQTSVAPSQYAYQQAPPTNAADPNTIATLQALHQLPQQLPPQQLPQQPPPQPLQQLSQQPPLQQLTQQHPSQSLQQLSQQPPPLPLQQLSQQPPLQTLQQLPQQPPPQTLQQLPQQPPPQTLQQLSQQPPLQPQQFSQLIQQPPLQQLIHQPPPQQLLQPPQLLQQQAPSHLPQQNTQQVVYVSQHSALYMTSSAILTEPPPAIPNTSGLVLQTQVTPAPQTFSTSYPLPQQTAYSIQQPLDPAQSSLYSTRISSSPVVPNLYTGPPPPHPTTSMYGSLTGSVIKSSDGSASVVPPPAVIVSQTDLGIYGSPAGIPVVKQEAVNSGVYGPAAAQQDVGMYGPIPVKQDLGMYGSALPKPEIGMYGPTLTKKEPEEEYDPAAPTDDVEGTGSSASQNRGGKDLSSREQKMGAFTDQPPVCPPADPEMLKVLEQLAVRVMLSGPKEEQNALQQHAGDPNYRFLQDKNSDEYKYFQWKVFSLSKRPVKGEAADADREDEGGDQDLRQPVRKKRRSRWGEQKATLAQPGVVTSAVGPPGVVVPTLGKPGVLEGGMSVPGVVTNIQLGGPVTIQPQPGMSQAVQSSGAESADMASYARKVIGSDSISAEQLKQIKEQQEMNFMYELVMAQKKMKERALMSEIEGIKVKRKYEYDSDEETEGGTWEHRQRAREMDETKKWAEKLTSGARGKHFLGDFLPPEELEKFLETFKALKEGREPDYSDYKEFQLTCENMGYQMLVKLGWTEGAGLGSQGQGITKPVNKGNTSVDGRGIGVERPAELTKEDDEYDAYRKRMMLAYRFRPNPLNNPRRPYY
ncbi:SURP and G-patch domain-containing protein 1-like protein [Elysia marginata]|uniref:SURP and G-patch domain-containing protein 1-like protein n=1 Tax=Elysia marginata TaxID=1093978 RepID=A0AAV4GDH1_9GAST|nr:SURP and G-patch domain-containing protein 1-like protein [Elysia marginata]